MIGEIEFEIKFGFMRNYYPISTYPLSLDLLSTISAAKNKADRMDDSSAIFLPAMAYAVPWSGEVRTTGIPAVKFTPVLKAMDLNGIRPWSWYIANTPSNLNWCCIPKKPSAA